MSLPKKETAPATPVITITTILVDDGHNDDRVIARATVPTADRESLVLAFRICQEVAEATGAACGVEQRDRKLLVDLDERALQDPCDLVAVMRAACERAVQKRMRHPVGVSTHTVEVR